jgi:hypothetical protein
LGVRQYDSLKAAVRPFRAVFVHFFAAKCSRILVLDMFANICYNGYMFANIHLHSTTNSVAIHFGGSRSLCSASAAVAQAVSQVLAVGAVVRVGCAIGADAQVIQAALAAGAASRLTVFAAFGQGGAGAWSGSAVSVVQAAAAAGAAVVWWAGGPASLPLRARLLRRSVAALSGCAASVFVSPGSGSLAVAAQAAQRGQPVFVLAASAAPLPLARCAGAWSPSSFAGLPAWQWVFNQKSLF